MVSEQREGRPKEDARTKRDEFADLFKATADLLARRSQIDQEAKARPMGSGLADKAKKVASDAAALARMKAIDLEAYQALARLGEAVYEKHGGDAGATDLVEPITRAITRRDQLDRDMKEMVPAAAKQPQAINNPTVGSSSSALLSCALPCSGRAWAETIPSTGHPSTHHRRAAQMRHSRN